MIILTAYGTVEDAVEAMKLGAYDFLIKTVDLGGVEPVVDRALEYLLLRRRVAFADAVKLSGGNRAVGVELGHAGDGIAANRFAGAVVQDDGGTLAAVRQAVRVA